MFGSGLKLFDCIDVHCEGEPARVLVGGFPPVNGNSMAEKRTEIIANHQPVCRLLLRVNRFYSKIVRHWLSDMSFRRFRSPSWILIEQFTFFTK